MYKLLILTLAVTKLFSLDIVESKEFFKKVTPDIYSIGFSANYQDKNLQDVHAIRYFNGVLKRVKKQESVCTGGEYYIHPRYNKQSKVSGYRGSIHFNCKSRSLDTLNRSLEKLRVATQHINAKTSQQPINVFVSEEKREKIKEDLKKEAITFREKYEASLSSMTGQKCFTENINFTTTSSAYPYRLESKSLRDVEAPIINQQKIAINVTYKIQCK